MHEMDIIFLYGFVCRLSVGLGSTIVFMIYFYISGAFGAIGKLLFYHSYNEVINDNMNNQKINRRFCN